MAESQAKRDARDRWNKLNPPATARISQDSYERLRQIASDRKISKHGLIKQIIMEWIESNAPRGF